MNKIILLAFIALLVVQSDQLEDPSRCRFFGKKCACGQFCYSPFKEIKIIEFCYDYKEIGSYCDGGAHRCAPGLECKPKKIGWYMKRFCQEAPKKSATESPTLDTMSTESSTMPIDITAVALTTNSVFNSTAESPTLDTMSSESSTMPIDITTVALTTNSVLNSTTGYTLDTMSTESSAMPIDTNYRGASISVFNSTAESPTLDMSESSTMPIDTITTVALTNLVPDSTTESHTLATMSTETSTTPFNITTVELTTNSGLTSPKNCRQWCTQICT
ncbi:hypothetical protein NPIL_350721 [Nephila pilipes]|uniref:Spider venom protein n=1 Tax=Nephila pilipes TaxID=299642 RepID=A0A8X6NXU7_NEPPI|nr:hypothetical protein NPIL_350721 [Nephila pilipes]